MGFRLKSILNLPGNWCVSMQVWTTVFSTRPPVAWRLLLYLQTPQAHNERPPRLCRKGRNASRRRSLLLTDVQLVLKRGCVDICHHGQNRWLYQGLGKGESQGSPSYHGYKWSKDFSGNLILNACKQPAPLPLIYFHYHWATRWKDAAQNEAFSGNGYRQ